MSVWPSWPPNFRIEAGVNDQRKAAREADIAALMRRARELQTPVDWLLRSKHNRSLGGSAKLWQSVGAAQSKGELRFTLPARQTQRAREVVQEIWAQTLQLPDGKGCTVQVSCVVAREVNLPAGVTPIEWRLVSNRSVDSLELSFATDRRVPRALGDRDVLSCPQERLPHRGLAAGQRGQVGVRHGGVHGGVHGGGLVHRTADAAGRSCLDLDAKLMFEPDEWRAAYILNDQKPPTKPPTLNEVVCWVARLGGLLARKSDGEPGVKTIWLSMQLVIDFSADIRYVRELQASGICV